MSSVSTSRGGPANDCWNRIGVQGDGSCSQLAQHIHCKNCPVYAAAAQTLLDRELPSGYGERWAQHFDRARVEADAEPESLLLFRIGGEWLALPTVAIDEVASPRPIHVLPHRRGGVVLGVANVRGELLVCVSLARLLGVEQVASEGSGSSRARLLIVRRAGNRFAVPVDEVHGTRRVVRSELTPTPATLGKAGNIFTSHVLSWTRHAVGCLDDELVMRALERSLT